MADGPGVPLAVADGLAVAVALALADGLAVGLGGGVVGLGVGDIVAEGVGVGVGGGPDGLGVGEAHACAPKNSVLFSSVVPVLS